MGVGVANGLGVGLAVGLGVGLPGKPGVGLGVGVMVGPPVFKVVRLGETQPSRKIIRAENRKGWTRHRQRTFPPRQQRYPLKQERRIDRLSCDPGVSGVLASPESGTRVVVYPVYGRVGCRSAGRCCLVLPWRNCLVWETNGSKT